MMNPCEAEVDAIRLKLYEETKHLTKAEKAKRIRGKVQKSAEQYGFTIIPSAQNLNAANHNHMR